MLCRLKIQYQLFNHDFYLRIYTVKRGMIKCQNFRVLRTQRLIKCAFNMKAVVLEKPDIDVLADSLQCDILDCHLARNRIKATSLKQTITS